MRISCIVCCLVGLLALAASAPAEVISVTVYPGSAQISEKGQLALAPGATGAATARLTLPAAADPQSLALTLPSGRSLIDVAFASTARTDQAAAAALKAQVEAARTARNQVQARADSLAAQLGFWKALTPGEKATPDEAARLAETLGASVEKVGVNLAATRKELTEKEQALKDLEDKLAALTGRAETVWEVTVTMSGQPSGQVEASYEYAVSGCGWTPVYRLNARPGEKVVDLGFDAEVWQSTGADWQTRVLLATLPQRSQLEPPGLPGWVIGPRPEIRPLAKAAPAANRMTMAAEADMAGAPPPPEPEIERRATYAVWDLGARHVAAGPKQRLRISEETLPAAFTYLIRPGMSTASFLRAELSLKEAADMPSGPALWLVEGALVGKRPFSFQGLKKEVYFGNDPQVRVKVTELERQAGERGLFKSKQSYAWKWAFEVQNDKTWPVTVRLEEPKPQPRDERIELTFSFDPKPTKEEDQAFVWLLDLGKAAKKTVTYGVALKAPEDLNLDLGWR